MWWGLDNPAVSIVEDVTGMPVVYRASWTPDISDWPKALKFTFTLYDSKGILKGGRTFTHIVYIGN